MNPIFDQLVVEFYLSKGLVPFTGEPVLVMKAADIRNNMGPKNPVIHDYVTLMASNPKSEEVAKVKHDYFRL